ncbi:Retrovirus-related Pol polyprotein from transposon TNT 1-94 [Vitis vinifera]|uniref:Retrovirus-related Pol polyprotein from transposon TNT 1-94 n=1 Tax=Vitis vinifera TaxID=29760 RepID=A0A438G4I1_VITVI|nr:Retrovirus-related Pol polyprotein from transposon TNT 1-94 [Vitis vinifera]
MPKQTPVKVMEGSDQLQFEVEHETLQPEKFTEPSSETVQEVVQERQDEPTQGLESYSLARDSSIRLLLAFIAHEDLELDQLDVKTTFLHRELDELIYMQPPKGFREGIKDGQRILGMEIERDRSKKVLRLSQKSYISKVLSRFEMNNVKTVSTPLGQHFRLSITQAPETHEEKRFMQMIPYASMVGSLMYTMVCSRPDLAYAVSMISRYMSCPRKATLARVTRVVNAYYVGNIDTRKSLTGYVFTVFGEAVS